MTKLKQKFFSGLKWTSVGMISLAVVSMLKISVLARFLDKEDFGLMALIMVVIGFTNLFSDMGITTAILHRQEISKKEYASLYWLNVGFSLMLYLLICGLAPVIASFYDEERLSFLIPLLGLNLIISAIGRMFKTIESKHLRFRAVTIFEMVAAGISLIIAVVLAVKGFGVLSLVYSALVQYLIQNVFFLIFGLRRYGLLFHFHFHQTKPFLKIGIYEVGGQVVNYFNRDVDILIVGKFFGQEVLGGYSLAKQLVFRPAQILNPIVLKVASPALAKCQADPKSLKDSYLNLVSFITKLNLVVYGALGAGSFFVVDLFYGAGYEDIYLLTSVLCIYMLFRAIGNPVGSLLVATGKTYLGFYWNSFTFLIIPVLVFFGARFGVLGIAIALNSTMVLLFYPSWWFLIRKMTGASFREYLWAVIRIPDRNFLKL